MNVSQSFTNLSSGLDELEISRIPFILNFLGVKKSSRAFLWPDSSGYLGLAPYSNPSANKNMNLLFQLRVQGVISHMVASVFVGEKGASLKIGSMDTNAILDGDITKMTTFRTADLSTWSLQVNNWEMGFNKW